MDRIQRIETYLGPYKESSGISYIYCVVSEKYHIGRMARFWKVPTNGVTIAPDGRPKIKDTSKYRWIKAWTMKI